MNVTPRRQGKSRHAADETYAALRVRGQVMVAGEDAQALVAALRRRAKADGLAVMASRESARHMTRDQARRRPYLVSLHVPGGGFVIVAPDAGSTP